MRSPDTVDRSGGGGEVNREGGVGVNELGTETTGSRNRNTRNTRRGACKGCKKECMRHSCSNYVKN